MWKILDWEDQNISVWLTTANVFTLQKVFLIALWKVSQLDHHFMFHHTNSSELLARNVVHFRLVCVSSRQISECVVDIHSQLWHDILVHVGGGLYKEDFRWKKSEKRTVSCSFLSSGIFKRSIMERTLDDVRSLHNYCSNKRLSFSYCGILNPFMYKNFI